MSNEICPDERDFRKWLNDHYNEQISDVVYDRMFDAWCDGRTETLVALEGCLVALQLGEHVDRQAAIDYAREVLKKQTPPKKGRDDDRRQGPAPADNILPQ